MSGDWDWLTSGRRSRRPQPPSREPRGATRHGAQESRPELPSPRVSPAEQRRIRASVRRWSRERLLLTRHREQLDRLAPTWPPPAAGADEPDSRRRALCPVPLSDLDLGWRASGPHPAVTSASVEAFGTRPWRADGSRFPDYGAALRALAPDGHPGEAHVGYRLLEADLGGPAPFLDFTMANQLEVVGLDEALAHEFAAAWARAGHRAPGGADMPLRTRVSRGPLLTTRAAIPSLVIAELPARGPWSRPVQVLTAPLFSPADGAEDNLAADFSLAGAVARRLGREVHPARIVLLGVDVEPLRLSPRLLLATLDGAPEEPPPGSTAVRLSAVLARELATGLSAQPLLSALG